MNEEDPERDRATQEEEEALALTDLFRIHPGTPSLTLRRLTLWGDTLRDGDAADGRKRGRGGGAAPQRGTARLRATCRTEPPRVAGSDRDLSRRRRRWTIAHVCLLPMKKL